MKKLIAILIMFSFQGIGKTITVQTTYKIKPKADLENTDLTKANLQGAYLRGAHLQGAKLSKADLTRVQKANLKGANLQRAKFNKYTILPFSKEQAIKKGMVFVP